MTESHPSPEPFEVQPQPNRRMRPDEQPHREYRSLFWPVVLIGAGVVLLLVNLGLLPAFSFWQLWRLWPILLIVTGVDILFARRLPIIGALLGVAVIAGVVLLLATGPLRFQERADLPGFALFQGGNETQQQSFSEPLGNARSAQIDLDLASPPTTVTVLEDSANLVEADILYAGVVRWRVSGDTDKRIVLDSEGVTQFFPWNWDGRNFHYDVRLSPQVPTTLNIDAGSGPVALDLARLRLEGLDIEGGSGPIDASLPATRQEIAIDGGSGPVNLELPDEVDATLDLRMGSGPVEVRVGEDVNLVLRLLDGGSGPLIVRVPQDAPVQVEVRDEGTGPVSLPRDFERVSSDEDEEEGVWENPRFASADRRIVIQINDVGSGPVTVAYR
ncbi:MAG: DUF4097 domain-containing protein [Chloroflexi bacterium]|jgi:hypothetical protein|nr:DUF4097 domain-containing protein [Chloroflexota bacterium]